VHRRAVTSIDHQCESKAIRSCRKALNLLDVHEYDRCQSGTSMRELVVLRSAALGCRPAS
jgi:hypothetical protein